MTAFNFLAFFRQDLIKSEASWKMSSKSHWLMQRRSWYEANRGTRLGKILTNFADHFYFT